MDSESLEISPHRRHAARFVELPSKEKAPGHSMRSLAFDDLAASSLRNDFKRFQVVVYMIAGCARFYPMLLITQLSNYLLE